MERRLKEQVKCRCGVLCASQKTKSRGVLEVREVENLLKNWFILSAYIELSMHARRLESTPEM